jgi:hypothetical protein
MRRLATIMPITLASSAGSRIDDTDHAKRQLRAAASLRSMASLEDPALLLKREISGDCLITQQEFPRRLPDNRDCIVAHRADLSMSVCSRTLRQKCGRQSAERMTFSAMFSRARKALGNAWQPGDGSTSPFLGACGCSMLADGRQRGARCGSAKHNIARLGRFSDARPTAEGRVYSVHPPGGLRVLWDNLLNDKQYADAIFLPLIAR